MARLSEQVRLKLREEMGRQKVSQRGMAGLLGWSQSRVAHLLNGRVEMSVDDMAELGFALSLSLSEIVRDNGLEFFAEMTPGELRLFQHLRTMPAADREIFAQFVGLTIRLAPERHAGPLKKRAIGRGK